MKKIFAFALAAAFALPTFAFTLKVGDEAGFAPRKTSPNGVVTKVAPTGNGVFEFSVASDDYTYSYIVSEGTEFKAFGKPNTKAKSNVAKTFKVKSVENNAIELEEIVKRASSVEDAK
ncbi:hypothetical protein [Treponema zioleckii]|uniref:hypothetical protein n=1 Tax=Treponema zioleckii TaxID=331680 RepID=UPI00168BCE3B|nr:hypothetical protein [Treponema zioleckii]